MSTPNNQPQSPLNGNGSRGLFSAPKQDFLSSIVVFLVALPLCMGIAIASGVPVSAGLITGIVGGLIVGWFAGSPLQVSGPAAGLAVIVYELVQKHGLEALGMAVLIGGAFQFLAGMLRYGRWFRAVSPAVIHGMLAGIGVLILSSQFHVMVDDAPKGSGLKNLLSIPEAIQKGLPLPELGTEEERTLKRDLLQEIGILHEQQIQLREQVAEVIPIPAEEQQDDDLRVTPHEPDPAELKPLAQKQQDLEYQLERLVERINQKGVAEMVRRPEELNKATQEAIAMMQVAMADLDAGNPEYVRRSQADIQNSLEKILSELKNHDWAAKVGLLTIITLLLWKALEFTRLKLIPAPLVAVVFATLVTTLLELPVLYVEVPDNLWSELHYPSLTIFESVSVGVIIQAGIVLAVVASAETLLCATAVDQMQSGPRTKYDRELAAQGIGNMICGTLGALPMTGVIVRSAANVESGAQTRLSAILHGLWLLVFVSFLSFMLRMIPTAALAAMLVYTGYKLVNIKAIKELRKYGKGEVFIYFVTLGTIVCTDLLTGVLTGMFLSAAKLLQTFSRLRVNLEVDQEKQVAILHLEGAATFIRLPVLAEELEKVPDNYELHVHFEQLNHIDHACLDLLMNWAKQHESSGGTLVIDWESLHANIYRGQNSDKSESAA